MRPRSLHLKHAASLFLKVSVNGIWLHVNISTHLADNINYAILNKGFILWTNRTFYGNHGLRFKSFPHFSGQHKLRNFEQRIYIVDKSHFLRESRSAV